MHSHLAVIKCFRDSKRTAKYSIHHTGKKMSVQICTCIVLFMTPDVLILRFDGLLYASSHATFISNCRGLPRYDYKGKVIFLCNLFLFFVFANDHSYLYKYKIIENVYTQFCSESLFSFLHAEVIFSKRREYMQNKTNKDVQN